MKITARQASAMLARAPKLIPIIAPKAALIAAHRTKAALVKLSPVDTGGFKNAWKVTRGYTHATGISGATMAKVENDHPIAGVIERGARPHPVSFEGQAAIKRWVIRKGIATREVGPGSHRGTAKQGPVQLKAIRGKQAASKYEAEVDRVVAAIVHKLATKGQKGLFLVRNHTKQATAWFRAECRRLIEAELKKVPAP